MKSKIWGKTLWLKNVSNLLIFCWKSLKLVKHDFLLLSYQNVFLILYFKSLNGTNVFIFLQSWYFLLISNFSLVEDERWVKNLETKKYKINISKKWTQLATEAEWVCWWLSSSVSVKNGHPVLKLSPSKDGRAGVFLIAFMKIFLMSCSATLCVCLLTLSAMNFIQLKIIIIFNTSWEKRRIVSNWNWLTFKLSDFNI